MIIAAWLYVYIYIYILLICIHIFCNMYIQYISLLQDIPSKDRTALFLYAHPGLGIHGCRPWSRRLHLEDRGAHPIHRQWPIRWTQLAADGLGAHRSLRVDGCLGWLGKGPGRVGNWCYKWLTNGIAARYVLFSNIVHVLHYSVKTIIHIYIMSQSYQGFLVNIHWYVLLNHMFSKRVSWYQGNMKTLSTLAADLTNQMKI